MAKENSREQKIRYIFGHNTKISELHVTSDDQAFTLERDAKNHAKTLENKEIALAKRGEYVSVSEKVADVEESVDREALFARHLELFGKSPAKTAKNETVSAKIAEEEARIAKESEDKGDGEGGSKE